MKEIIITSSVLIICVMLIRYFFKGKISSRLQYALWLLVAVRLMMPVSAQIYLSLGAMDQFRVMELAERLEEKIGDLTGRLEEPFVVTMDMDSPVGGRIAGYLLGEEMMEFDTADGPTSIFLAGKAGTWLDIFRGIWFGGMGIAAVWMITVNLRFAWKLHKNRREFLVPEEVQSGLHEKLSGIFAGDTSGRDGQNMSADTGSAPVENVREKKKEKQRHGLRRRKRRVRVYTVDCLTSPCLYGLPGREAVYLPENIVGSGMKLRHVLTHEICHKRHGDSFWSILRSVLLVFYWFHPLVWAAAVLSKRDCELACDESALILLGDKERIDYGKTLLTIIAGKGKLSDIACTATTMTGSGKSVRERVYRIAGQPKVLGSAVAAVVVLLTVASVFIFTKSPQFSGGIWEEGPIYVMTADKRVMLPETIAGISGYAEVEGNRNDLIIYQTASGQEVGRFCTVTYEEAVALVETGRGVAPLGDYGRNAELMGKLHVFTPVEDATEYSYSLPDEEIITSEFIPEEPDSVTEHEYTAPNMSEKAPFAFDGKTEWEDDGSNKSAKKPFLFDGQSEWRNQMEPEQVTENPENGVPGTDSNTDDTTYLIENSAAGQDMTAEEKSTDYIPEEAAEGSVERLPEEKAEESVQYLPEEQIEESAQYLPEEQITTIRREDPYLTDCYLYVTADHSGVRDKYLEEMEYIDRELKAAAGQTIVTSVNREVTEETFETLARHKTQYLGDNSAVLALVDALPQPEGMSYQEIELHTGGEPENMALQIRYSLQDDEQYIDRDVMRFNAVMLFATIENLEECIFRVEEAGGSLVEDVAYTREELTEQTGVERLWTQLEGEELQDWLKELHQRVIK